MKYYTRKGKESSKKIVLDRMRVLYELAMQEFSKHRYLADRYAVLIKKLASSNRAKIPASIRIHLCRDCDKFLMPGINLKVRISDGVVYYECLECGHRYRKFLSREQKERRRNKS